MRSMGGPLRSLRSRVAHDRGDRPWQREAMGWSKGRRPQAKRKEKSMTTNSHHTPGPWEHDWTYIVAPDPAGVHPDIYIAQLAEEDEEGRVAPEDQLAANGQLLAAAPELLAALDDVLFVLNPDDRDGGYFICEEAEPVIETARQAIAKARGDTDEPRVI